MNTVPPTHLAYDDVKTALEGLGLTTKDLREVVFERDQIVARYIRRTDDGKAVAAGLGVAEVTYEIGIIR